MSVVLDDGPCSVLDATPARPHRLKQAWSLAYYRNSRLLAVDIGYFFGYPNCCRQWFRHDVLNASQAHLQRELNYGLHGTGYRPCPDCLRKPLPELYREIQKNRLCHEPFPLQPERDGTQLHGKESALKILERHSEMGASPPTELVEWLKQLE